MLSPGVARRSTLCEDGYACTREANYLVATSKATLEHTLIHISFSIIWIVVTIQLISTLVDKIIKGRSCLNQYREPFKLICEHATHKKQECNTLIDRSLHHWKRKAMYPLSHRPYIVSDKGFEPIFSLFCRNGKAVTKQIQDTVRWDKKQICIINERSGCFLVSMYTVYYNLKCQQVTYPHFFIFICILVFFNVRSRNLFFFIFDIIWSSCAKEIMVQTHGPTYLKTIWRPETAKQSVDHNKFLTYLGVPQLKYKIGIARKLALPKEFIQIIIVPPCRMISCPFSVFHSFLECFRDKVRNWNYWDQR